LLQISNDSVAENKVFAFFKHHLTLNFLSSFFNGQELCHEFKTLLSGTANAS
jgi:hypothetical protein